MKTFKEYLEEITYVSEDERVGQLKRALKTNDEKVGNRVMDSIIKDGPDSKAFKHAQNLANKSTDFGGSRLEKRMNSDKLKKNQTRVKREKEQLQVKTGFSYPRVSKKGKLTKTATKAAKAFYKDK